MIMLRHLDFDRRFLKRPCYRLRPEVTKSDWSRFEQIASCEAIFADLKAAASDLKIAHSAFQRSFRKICTQVELVHTLTNVEAVGDVVFRDRLELTNDQQRAHAEHFQASRFRQDPLIPTKVAIDLCTAWIAHSLSGHKRVATIGANFCSFADTNGVRHIDLLSVLEKRRGYATQLLKAVTCDARSKSLKGVLVTTEVENEGAMRAYEAAGFNVSSFANVFHFKN
jgi:hypothetical protein